MLTKLMVKLQNKHAPLHGRLCSIYLNNTCKSQDHKNTCKYFSWGVLCREDIMNKTTDFIRIIN